jgi:hypothetical protein
MSTRARDAIGGWASLPYLVNGVRRGYAGDVCTTHIAIAGGGAVGERVVPSGLLRGGSGGAREGDGRPLLPDRYADWLALGRRLWAANNHNPSIRSRAPNTFTCVTLSRGTL